MIIGVAGPYSAETEDQKQKNLDRLNTVAAQLLEKGHIPIIGINAALPIVNKSITAEKYKALMNISLAVMDTCDALLFLAESPGANRERDLFLSKGYRYFMILTRFHKKIVLISNEFILQY